VLIALISDTHLPARRPPAARTPASTACGASDLIVHAGDISTSEVLADIEAIGPEGRSRSTATPTAPSSSAPLPAAASVDAHGANLTVVHDRRSGERPA